jgi:hypothetical protein
MAEKKPLMILLEPDPAKNVEWGLESHSYSGLRCSHDAMALGVAVLEIDVGIFVIDYFLIPLQLAVLWSVSTPL